MSTSTEYMDGLNAPVERRFYPRVAPPAPIWIAFGPNNLGVLQDLSENGFQITTPASLALNSVYRVLIPFKNPKKTVVVTVRTIWTNDEENRSGIQLLDLSEEDRMHVRQIVDSELERYEGQSPDEAESQDTAAAPMEAQSSLFRHGTVHDGEASSFHPWPAEWQREDWQNIDVEHEPGGLASGSAEQPNAGDRAPELRESFGAVQEESAERESYSQFAPPAHESGNESAEETAPSTFVEQSEVKAAEVHGADANAEPPSETDATEAEPASAFLGSLAAEPPQRNQGPRPAVPEPQELKRGAVRVESSADLEAALPPIANPFEEPLPHSRFQQFPPVPLPIHREFEYTKPSSSRRRRGRSPMRVKPMILWAAALAIFCFGASALVRQKISQNSRRFAPETAQTTQISNGAVAETASRAADTSATSSDSPSTSPSNGDSSLDQQHAHSSSRTAVLTERDDSSSVTTPATSRPSARNSGNAQIAVPTRSDPDGSNTRADQATAPPIAEHSSDVARASQPAPTSQTSGATSSTTPLNDAPQSTSAAVSPSYAPSARSSRSSGTTELPGSAPALNANAGKTQPAGSIQSPSNTQPQNSASNAAPPANTITARPQSPIYNANAPQQRSAIIGSINSVHSSGIFDSKDTTNASAATPAASRGNNANGGANAGARNVANSSMVPIDSPQERDLEIAAPKGFTASYVDLPGEHVVRTATATVRVRRFVRVPGERIPGQRWLWRGKLNVTLGDVVNRIDPSVVQASGATGSLTVQASIDKDGYVTDLKPINGNFAMLPSVSRAVRNWHYEPTYLDNKRAETQAEIEFDLRPTAASSRATPR